MGPFVSSLSEALNFRSADGFYDADRYFESYGRDLAAVGAVQAVWASCGDRADSATVAIAYRNTLNL